jgi:lipopolysaccharide/colanic/teichoic acid biosynthesis glycosyltransferase/O-antigen ligase
LALSLAFCAVPLSIAVTESLLAVALALRVRKMVWHLQPVSMPRELWFWFPWAGLEILSWLHSPEMRAGFGEIRHLLLPVAVFLSMPALDRMSDRVAVWRGLLVMATIGSGSVICGFVYRLLYYRHELAVSPDPSMYLRTGGLLHHWMIYGTVEIMAFAGLLEFWHFYPEERRRLVLMAAVNGLAIVLSLTRTLWICTLVLLAVHLFRYRSKWIWATPLLPILLLLVAPVRDRVRESLHPDYYANAERLQMLRVGWQIILQYPLTGVGPGRIEGLYRTYLSAADPVPAYHGHLHNNAIQLAAEFGLPVLLAATAFVGAIFIAVSKRSKSTEDRDMQFLCRASLLGLAGFLMAGTFEYTYGHSLGLIFVSFLVLSPLEVDEKTPERHELLQVTDRIFALILLGGSLPILVTSTILIRFLSRRSPFIAHSRAGHNGQPFWMLKLRTMWPPDVRASPGELGWIQKIDAEPSGVEKLKVDPRVTSRFAAFCRRYSIDELPQLLHVVRGEMSLVGPRPLTRGELAKHYGSSSNEILTVRPGLTGYWQISGRSRLSYAERVNFDLELVRSLSARVYFLVLLKTFPRVFSGDNAW